PQSVRFADLRSERIHADSIGPAEDIGTAVKSTAAASAAVTRDFFMICLIVPGCGPDVPTPYGHYCEEKSAKMPAIFQCCQGRAGARCNRGGPAQFPGECGGFCPRIGGKPEAVANL